MSPSSPNRRDTRLAADTAAARESRRERHRAALKRARRQRRGLLLAVLAATVFVAGWRAFTPDVTPPPASAPADPSAFAADRSSHDTPQAPATPVFATYRTLEIHLPVPVEDLTEIAFHQASGTNALPMTSLLPDADPSLADDKRGTGRAATGGWGSDAEGTSTLGGEVIRMWRTNRTGPPDTSADVGAPPGTPVIAPVSGTVVEVKPHLLYGRYEDIQIHIQPTGWPEIDLVVIHVADVTVTPGDVVTGGVTRIASVRLLSDRVTHQLSEYTRDGGDHVHFQLNRVTEPGASEPVGES